MRSKMSTGILKNVAYPLELKFLYPQMSPWANSYKRGITNCLTDLRIIV